MGRSAQGWTGHPIPSAELAEYNDGDLTTVDTKSAFGRGCVLIAGMPGAFSPICSCQHAPNLIANASRLLSALDSLACVVTSDPFVVHAWAQSMGHAHSIRFLPDGSLAFARAPGLTSKLSSPFLGERSERYVVTIKDGVIERVLVEGSVLDFQCTKAESLFGYV